MARIHKGEPEEGRKGRMGGAIYYQVGDRTYVRSMPYYPKRRVMKTAVRKKQTMLFNMVQQHISQHLFIINNGFERVGMSSPRHQYQKCNSKVLYKALDALADRYIAEGLGINIDEVEQAICDYAKQHPNEIYIFKKEGLPPVMLTGEWPTQISLVFHQ